MIDRCVTYSASDLNRHEPRPRETTFGLSCRFRVDPRLIGGCESTRRAFVTGRLVDTKKVVSIFGTFSVLSMKRHSGHVRN